MTCMRSCGMAWTSVPFSAVMIASWVALLTPRAKVTMYWSVGASGVGEGEGLGEGEGEGEASGLGEGEASGLGSGVGSGDGSGEASGVGSDAGVGVGSSVGSGDGVASGVGDGSATGAADGESEGSAPSAAVGANRESVRSIACAKASVRRRRSDALDEPMTGTPRLIACARRPGQNPRRNKVSATTVI